MLIRALRCERGQSPGGRRSQLAMRLELFFKTAGELKALIGFLRNTPTVTAVNLTNKVKSEPLLPNISTLKVG